MHFDIILVNHQEYEEDGVTRFIGVRCEVTNGKRERECGNEREGKRVRNTDRERERISGIFIFASYLLKSCTPSMSLFQKHFFSALKFLSRNLFYTFVSPHKS